MKRESTNVMTSRTHLPEGLRRAAALALCAFCGIGPAAAPGLRAQEPTPPAISSLAPPSLPPLPVVTIGQALRAALAQNPDLLNAVDALSSSRWAEKAVASS